jgi:putative DNA primase/helicase
MVEQIKHAEPLNRDQRIETEIERLRQLTDVQYEYERGPAAKRLGVRTTALDRLVARGHALNSNIEIQGRALSFDDPEPWPGPVDGAELLDDLAKAVRRYVVLDDAAADAIALWIVHCYVFDFFNCTPRLAVTSPEKRCGKTTLLDVLYYVLPRALLAANVTAAAVFRIIEQAKPTLLIDEADTFLNKNDEIRGILNSGHRRGGSVLRTVGEDHTPRAFATFAAAAISMIGGLPETLADRAIGIRLKRALKDETKETFRHDRTSHLRELASKAARWAQDNGERLKETDPDMGPLLNRRADNWLPLFAIAELAGGDWPERARQSAADIEGTDAGDDQSVSVQLLQDLRVAFKERGTDRLRSSELVALLTRQEDRPWPEFRRDRPITTTQLAQLLKPFGVSPRNIRLNDGMVVKGYYLADLRDLFDRYVPSPAATPVHPDTSEGPKGYAATAPERLCSGSVAAPSEREVQQNQRSSGVAGKLINEEEATIPESEEGANATDLSPGECDDLGPGQEVEIL